MKNSLKIGEKVLHGQHIRRADGLLVKKMHFFFLSRRELKAEAESEVLEAQAHELWTKYHAINIEKRNRKQMQTLSTVWRDDRPHDMKEPNNGERTLFRLRGTSLCWIAH